MLKVIDLFAGVGGLSYAFAKDPNFNIVAANEILQPMAEAYRLNHPNTVMYNSDVTEFSKSLLKQDLGDEADDIDIIVGGPPCQAYSTVGKRLIDDPRGKLFQEYFRLLQEFAPDAFIFENVLGLLSMAQGDLIKTIVDLFESIGYNVQYEVLNAADFGAPQTRRRVIIAGTKLNKPFEFPSPTHASIKDKVSINEKGLLPHVTLGEAIGDLPFLVNRITASEYYSEPQNEFQQRMRNRSQLLVDHHKSNYNERLIAIMENLPEGGTPKDLPESIRPSSGFGNSYSRLWWDKPSTTITRNLGTPSSSRCIHPFAPRALTTREGARLQGFPDDYVFVGSRSQKNLQIGNAVPTFVSEALKDSLWNHFY